MWGKRKSALNKNQRFTKTLVFVILILKKKGV